MASLKKMIFRTLPLASAWNAAKGGQNREPKLIEVARLVSAFKDINDSRLEVQWPDIATFAQQVQDLQKPPPPGQPPRSRDNIPLWGYKATGSYNKATDFSCLVDEVKSKEFCRMLVLSSVEFGNSESRTSDDFDAYVTIELDKRPPGMKIPVDRLLPGEKKRTFRLDLGPDAYVASYATHDTWTSGAGDTLWKNRLFFDPSFVHVFLYDLVRTDDNELKVEPVKKTDKKALDEFYRADEELEAARKAGDDAKDVDAGDVLFKDDLWNPHPPSDAPNGAVPSTVVIGTVIARIVVACSITVSRWDEQAAAGRATGEALIFPHIMIASTLPLDGASGGVRLIRPTQWNMLEMHHLPGTHMNQLGPHDIPKTMMDYMNYGMTKEIEAELIADSNRDAMTVGDVFGPFVVWANLFNYYIDGAYQKLGGKAIQVVRRLRTEELDTDLGYGYVNRDTSDILPGLGAIASPSSVIQTFRGSRVTKYARQGAFDNIHVAPRMLIPEGLIKSVIPANTSDAPAKAKVTSADFAQFKMDKIAMAPFCPHDCFHMHWRWTDNDNRGQIATQGWSEDGPNSKPGAPMVRHNQDVWLGLPSPSSILYLAEIHGVPADDWQVICHHGAFYALTTSVLVDAAQLEVQGRIRNAFYGANQQQQIPLSYWSLFYWCLRYKVIVENGHLVVKERTTFTKGWKAAADL